MKPTTTHLENLMLELIAQHHQAYAGSPVTDDLAGHCVEIYSKKQAAAVLRSLVKKGLLEAKPDRGFGERWTKWVIKPQQTA